MKNRIALFAVIALVPAAASANPCSNLRCKQAQKAALLIGEAYEHGKKIVMLVDGQPEEQEYKGDGSFCPGFMRDNNLGSTVEFNHQEIDPSLLYIDGKNLGTSIGCEHEQKPNL